MLEFSSPSKLDPVVPTHVYNRRWYILFIFSIQCLLSSTIWLTWGPVEKLAEVAFPTWKDGTIALFTNWGAFVFFPSILPCMVLINKSLRWSVVMSSGLLALGTCLRCIKFVVPGVSDYVFTITCHICAALSGISGIVFCTAPAMVSATWFPPGQRVTATSISLTSLGLGSGLSFLLASEIVKNKNVSSNNHSNNSCQYLPENNHTLGNHSAEDIKNYRDEIGTYMYTMAVPSIVFFFLVLVYFPSKPPLPPSLVEESDKLSLTDGIKQVLKNKNGWLLMIVNGISQAISGSWGAMMVTNLSLVSVNGECLRENWIDILAVVSCLITTVCSILIARMTDYLKGHMKMTIISLLAGAGVVYTLLSLVCIGFIVPPSFLGLEISVFLLLVLGNCLCNSTGPLLMEFSVEVCYPASEVITGCWLFLGINVVSMVFLLVFMIPNVGSSWLNYVLPSSCFLCLPLLALVKEQYKRMEREKVL